MSSKWIAIIVGSLLGAALLGISIQMLSIPHMIVSENDVTSPVAKENPGQSTKSPTAAESITNESAPQEPVQILSSQTTPIQEEPLP